MSSCSLDVCKYHWAAHHFPLVQYQNLNLRGLTLIRLSVQILRLTCVTPIPLRQVSSTTECLSSSNLIHLNHSIRLQ